MAVSVLLAATEHPRLSLGPGHRLLVPSGDRNFTAKQFTTSGVKGGDFLVSNRSGFGLVPELAAAVTRSASDWFIDIDVLERAASELATVLNGFDGVIDINDGFADGKEQLDLKLKPEARALGLTETSMARQLRSSFFGAQAIRQQRGRDEVRVYVRLPKEERRSEYDIDNIYLRTPSGGEILWSKLQM